MEDKEIITVDNENLSKDVTVPSKRKNSKSKRMKRKFFKGGKNPRKENICTSERMVKLRSLKGREFKEFGKELRKDELKHRKENKELWAELESGNTTESQAADIRKRLEELKILRKEDKELKRENGWIKKLDKIERRRLLQAAVNRKSKNGPNIYKENKRKKGENFKEKEAETVEVKMSFEQEGSSDSADKDVVSNVPQKLNEEIAIDKVMKPFYGYLVFELSKKDGSSEATNSNCATPDVSRDLGRQWTALPDEEKELYYAKTNALKIKYDEEMAEYKKLQEIDDKLQELEKRVRDLKKKKEELKDFEIPKADGIRITQPIGSSKAAPIEETVAPLQQQPSQEEREIIEAETAVTNDTEIIKKWENGKIVLVEVEKCLTL